MSVRQRKEIQEVSRRTELGTFGRLTAATLLLGVLVHAEALWPEQWREHHRERVQSVNPDSQLWNELSGEASEKAHYSGPSGPFTGTAYRFKDATSALAWYEFIRPENAVPTRGAATTSTTPGANYIAHLNYVLVFEGWRPLERELTALYKALPKGRAGGGLPVLIRYLPEKDRIRNSERYVAGLHSLELFLPAVPATVAGMEDSPEAAVASYHAGNGDVTLAVFEYPTPQIARAREAGFVQHPGWQIKRSGALIAVVPNGSDTAAVKALLDNIEWNLEFTWYESAKRPLPPNVGAMLVGAIELTGVILGSVMVGGVIFAALGVWLRRRGLKDGEEPGMIVLGLND